MAASLLTLCIYMQNPLKLCSSVFLRMCSPYNFCSIPRNISAWTLLNNVSFLVFLRGQLCLQNSFSCVWQNTKVSKLLSSRVMSQQPWGARKYLPDMVSTKRQLVMDVNIAKAGSLQVWLAAGNSCTTSENVCWEKISWISHPWR